MAREAAVPRRGGGGVAWLVLLAAAGMAAAGVGSSAGNGSVPQNVPAQHSDNPCAGKPGSHVLRDYGHVKLTCRGFRHVRRGHGAGSVHHILRCLASALGHGASEIRDDGSVIFRWPWNGESGSSAAAVVAGADGIVRTAWPGIGGWAKCAGAGEG